MEGIKTLTVKDRNVTEMGIKGKKELPLSEGGE